MAHVEDLWTRPGPDRRRERNDRWGRGKRWRARWVEPNGRERSQLFATKADAEDALARTSVSLATGQYVHHAAGATTVGQWLDVWLATKAHKRETTKAGYTSLVRRWVNPTWQHVPLNRVQHEDVQAWITVVAGRVSASRTHQAYRVLSQALDFAVRSKKIAFNPARGVDLPSIPDTTRTYLTHDQIAAAAAACGAHELLILVLAYTGIREGEAFDLRAAAVDPLRRRLHVQSSASWVNGRLVVNDDPKSHRKRFVAVPGFLAQRLAAAVEGLAPDSLVFPGPRGGHLRSNNFLTRVWYPALEAAGVPRVTLHELRHSAASLAIAAGADVKVVQSMLGHADAATTLNIYAHLLDDRLDEVADALDAAARAAETARRRHAAPSNVIPMRRRAFE